MISDFCNQYINRLFFRKLERAKHSLHVQNILRKSRQVDWTYRVLSARLSVLRARAESLVHGLPLGVTVQRLPCTSRQVCWTYRVYFARSGMLWCPQKTLAACKRSACELFKDHFLETKMFFVDEKVNKYKSNVRHVQKSMWTFTLKI